MEDLFSGSEFKMEVNGPLLVDDSFGNENLME